MTIPPERIRIKRRRDEDPVDALFIQQKKHRPSVCWTRLDEHGSPVRPSYDVPVQKVGTTLSSHNEPTTVNKPSNTKNSLNTEACNDLERDLNAPHRPLATKRDSDCLQLPQRIAAHNGRLRKFKLSKCLTSQTGGDGHGVRKERKQSRAHLAIFEEKITRAFTESIKVNDQPLLKEHTPDFPIGFPTSQKRPNANRAEQAWRKETWDQATKSNHSPKVADSGDHFDLQSMELAIQLQQYAEDMIRQESDQRTSDDRRVARFQPKPPKSRESIRSINSLVPKDAGTVTDIHENDNGSEYIFDTYIRDVASQFYSELPCDPMQSFQNNNVGLIVIEEAEEGIWETFGECENNEQEFSSDEDDENAEDFHGNDYPEDELEWDDEFNMNAYHHRKYASDDEDFDEMAEWSDEEQHADRPWEADLINRTRISREVLEKTRKN